MQVITTFRINATANSLYEAFVDPNKIGNFWFSYSSERWEAGKNVRLEYVEYNAVVDIQVVSTIQDKEIVFQWGQPQGMRTIMIAIEETETKLSYISIREEGFNEANPDLIGEMLDNKEGWMLVLLSLKAYLENGINTLRTGLVKGEDFGKHARFER